VKAVNDLSYMDLQVSPQLASKETDWQSHMIGLRNLLKKYSGPLPIILKLGKNKVAIDSKFWVNDSGDLLREINSLNWLKADFKRF
jgi:hypothetical protein